VRPGSVYLGFVGLSRVLGGGRGFWRFAAAYAFSLVPIAVAYQVADYYKLLLVRGAGVRRPPLGPVRVGVEPLRHRGVPAPVRPLGRGVCLVFASRADRGRARRSRVPGAPDLAAPPARPETPCSASFRCSSSWSSPRFPASGSLPSPSSSRGRSCPTDELNRSFRVCTGALRVMMRYYYPNRGVDTSA
jgi:hypothetical protein